MNKTVLLSIIAGAVIIGGVVMLTSDKGTDTDTSNETSEISSETFSGSVKDLMASGKDVTCTFNQEVSGAVSNGTAYVSGKGEKVRVDFTASVAGESMSGSAIIKDGYNYAWGDTPFGSFATKVAINESDAGGDTEGFDVNETVDYSCSSWKVDNSKFDVPTDREFTEISAMVNTSSSGDMKALQCGACDQLPDANTKAQCKAALGC